MKFCINCKHYVPANYSGGYGIPYHYGPAMCINPKYAFIDVVTGSMWPTEAARCRQENTNLMALGKDRRCLPSGEGFVPRIETQWWGALHQGKT